MQFIKWCQSYQINKKTTEKPAELLNPIKKIAGQPLQRITIDFIGSL